MLRPAVGAAVILVACELPFAPGTGDYAGELLRRKGEIADVVSEVTDSGPGHRIHDFLIRSTSGLEVRGRLRVPDDAGPDDRRAAAVILGGIQRGADAITLVRDSLPQVAAALWYPERLDAEDAADALRNLEGLKEVAWDIPASVLLTMDYLVSLPSVDPDRLALVGASFGGFFAPVAAATDPRIANLGLLYAGGDLAALLAGHLEDQLPPSVAILGAEMAVLRLQRLEPIRYVGDVSPRPVLLVNGMYDDLILRESARALIRATGQPRDVVWLPTGHLDPDNEPLLKEIVDTALARMPVLQ
jgi:hypothetical protein